MQLTSNYVALKANLHYTRIGAARLKCGTCAGFYWHGTRKFLCVNFCFYPCRDPEHSWANAVPYKMIPVCFDVRMLGTFSKSRKRKRRGAVRNAFTRVMQNIIGRALRPLYTGEVSEIIDRSINILIINSHLK